MTTTTILEGINVLDFTHIVAGPHCTKLMAEYGADVIKIEPPNGDPARGLPVIREGRSAYFVQHNLGKKTMAMDLAEPEARDICLALVRESDVVVENFSPGVMRRLGLDWDTLRQVNPDLIMCSISCFGQTGPLSHLPGYDFIGQSYAGILDMNGEPDRCPVFTDLAFGDVSTGTHAYAAILSALFHKFRGNGGQYIDISLVDVLFSYQDMGVQLYDASAGQLNLTRGGTKHPFLSPFGIYECGGKHIFILANRSQWLRLVELIDRPDMLDDPRFADISTRGKHRQIVDEAINAWLANIGDADEALRQLQQSLVPAAPLLTIPEILNHPHMAARKTVRTVLDPVFGQLKIPNNPFRFSQFPESRDLRAGFLGQHNREILRDRLGFTEVQISELEHRGVITSKRI